jgi:hypothetical protein
VYLDGTTKYPDSVVIYCWFPNYSLREMFGYLREKEDTIKRDIRRHAGTRMEILLRARLEEVEAHLIWMAHNVKTAPQPPPRSRKKKNRLGDEVHEQLSIF